MISMEQAMDCLVGHISGSVKSSTLSGIVERLLWCLDEDSEKAIFRVRDTWVCGNDLRRVEVALFMEESFPFDNRDEMVRQFSRIARQWPHLRDRCEAVRGDLESVGRVPPAPMKDDSGEFIGQVRKENGDREISVNVSPEELAWRSTLSLSSSAACSILRGLEVVMPSRLSGIDRLGSFLRSSPVLTLEKIKEFVFRAAESAMQRKIEFIVEYFVRFDGGAKICGRCGSEVVHVEDVFVQRYRRVPVDEVVDEIVDVYEVDIRIVGIRAYGRRFNWLDPGITAELEVRGGGFKDFTVGEILAGTSSFSPREGPLLIED